MDYRQLHTLREKHPAWRLLTAKNAPFVASFLHRTFIAPNLRVCPESELIAKLDDYLFHLRRELGEDSYPRGARAYLDNWCSDSAGWLRKSYASGSDDPIYDLSPSAEQALGWLQSLWPRDFIGTESRLITIFDILRQLVQQTETDPETRVRELERQREEIDAEIDEIRQGKLRILEPPAIRDRFAEVQDTARSLLSDFRAVEQNFRELDRGVRERIAIWDGQKGDLLDEIFGERDAISESHQGRSFSAFFELLMSEERQLELEALLTKVLALDPVKDLLPDRRLKRMHHDWITAGESTQRTIAQLSGELRRYLDDKVWLENRRIMEILRGIEHAALEVRDSPPKSDDFMAIDDLGPSINLVMDRPLFSPPYKPKINDAFMIADDGEVPADALFDLVHVDKAQLKERIWRALHHKNQVTLFDIVEHAPLEQGLAELIAYLSIASDHDGAIIDDTNKQTIHWVDDSGLQRQATMPLVIFTRSNVRLVNSEMNYERT